MKYFCKFSNLFLVLALLAGLLGQAQPVQAAAPLRPELWVTNGVVRASLISGSTLYIGGDFSYVGPSTGSFAILNANGVPDMNFPPVNGTIYAIMPDGAGGWYVGGSFVRIWGYTCHNLAHLKADKSLDFTWCPNPDDAVRSLAMSDNTIYVGGSFHTIGGRPRNNIAALDAITGTATDWNPNANGSVTTLMIAHATLGRVLPLSGVSSNTIYAGGGFTSIGGQGRNYIAALDASTGLATNWNPNANNYVNTLVVTPSISGVSGSTIYAGGYFTGIGGRTRNYIAALDANTGLAIDWDPNADQPVITLATKSSTLGASGTTVYAGGGFSSIGGQTRRFIAALDANTGLATNWNPNINNYVNTLVVSGNAIYAGGNIDSVVALDADTGATTWASNANGLVYALATSGSMISVGGTFGSIGGQHRNHLAALDTSTGALTTWNPNADDMVSALAANGNTIYAGGGFFYIGGQVHPYIAALDASTGLAADWGPVISGGGVSALAVAPPIPGVSGSTIYVGGGFNYVGGQPRNHIAALDADTGLVTAWNPDAGYDVYSLAVAPAVSGTTSPFSGTNGSTIYVGGAFHSIGGQPRRYIAALDASTGLATDWNPNANNAVYALAVAPPISGVNGSTVYAGGNFTSISGQTRNFIAALDASTGLATTWNPNADGWVFALVVVPPISETDGSTIYAGGYFINIGGQPRNKVAALDANTGLATIWNPDAYAGGSSVQTLTVATPLSRVGRMVYIGGWFTSIAGQRRDNLAVLRDGTVTCQSAASGGSWQASNWSNCGGTIPGDGDSVEIQAGHTITLYGNLAANNLTINAGSELDLPQDVTLSVEGTLTQNGRLTQTQPVVSGKATTFLNIRNAAGNINQYFGLTLTPTDNMGDTRVTIAGNQNCTSDPGDILVQRCFKISPATPRKASIRFYYNQAELNGQTYNRLNVLRQNFRSPQGIPYRYSATCNTDQPDCWVEASNVSVYGDFVFDSKVYVVTLLPWLWK